MLYDAIKRVSPGYYQHDIQAHWNIFKSSGDNPTAIPQDTLPLDMLTPQIRHYELCQKYSRSANFSDFFTPSYAIFDFVTNFPDMLILVLFWGHCAVHPCPQITYSH